MKALKVLFVTAVISITAGMSAHATEKYAIDRGHTEVIFGWSHAGVSMQHGEFTNVSGILTLEPDNLEQSKIDVTIDAKSVRTGVEEFDGHLNGPQWLHTLKFPEIRFVSTSIEVTGDETAKITGDLTLRGVTKPVVLDTKLTHRGAHPVGKWMNYYKGPWVAFHAKTKIDHQAFGVGSYSTGPIFIEINTEMKGQK